MEHLLFVVYLFSILIAVGFGYWAVFRTEMRSKWWFGLVMGGVALWALLAAAELLVSNSSDLIVIQTLSLAVGLTMSLFWLLFTADYTYRSVRTNPIIQGYAGVYLLLLVTALSTSLHGFYASFIVRSTPFSHVEVISGPARLLAVVYTLAGMALGTYYLASLFQRGRSRVSTPTIIFSGAVLFGSLPFVGSVFNVLPVQTYNYTPLGTSIFVLGIGYVVVRHNFYNLAPIAREIVVDDIIDPLFVLDRQLRLVDYNAAATNVVPELTTGSLGIPVSKLHPKLAALVDNPSGTQENEITLPCPDGTRNYLAQPSEITQDTETIGIVFVLRDVTKLHEREQQLERQNDRLDQFASVISHDLRNPIAVAKGYLEHAQATGDLEHLEKVSSAHNRMETMIDEMLALARAETRINETTMEWVPLQSVVTEAWETAETGDAMITTDIPAGYAISADPAVIGNILENLFRNAADHNESPTTVTVGTVDSQGFYVEDDGTGIPEAKREAVLEHGYTTGHRGTGLGLSIVRQLVSAHRWQIHVTEAGSGGARFEITGVTVE